ncbi:InlB B-repeat-containing protein, partial [Collinsella intestinalis]|uniref:InlB B-repeat-containing protein n=1 Tax=Collinsella intestinalis TaxID=147207 RepID=UPI0025A3F6EB
MHVPQKLRKELKRKGTKALAFFLAFVLAVQCMNLPVIVAAATDAAGNALATVEDTPSNDQATSTATDQAADQAATETEQPATEQAPVEQPAEPAEPAEPATEEPAATEAPAADQPGESTTPAGSENVTEGGASENGQAPVAPAADTTATVALSLSQSTLTVGADTYTATDKTMEAPANQELKFSVAPEGGFAVKTVKQIAADRTETELSADASGTYTVAPEAVADGLEIKVETEEAPAAEEQPAEEAPAEEPATDESTDETTEPAEDEAATEEPAEEEATADDEQTPADEATEDEAVEEAMPDASNGISTLSISGQKQVAIGETIRLSSDSPASSGGWRPQTYTHKWNASPSNAVSFSNTSNSGADVTGNREGSVAITHEWGYNNWRGQWQKEGSETYTITVYQADEEDLCTITFDTNGGSWNNSLNGTHKFVMGHELWPEGQDLSVPTRNGYVFEGWTPAVSRVVSDDATYTAQWKQVGSNLTPVYVYLQVNGDTSGLILNYSGWYTVGVIYMPSNLVPNTGLYQDQTVNLNNQGVAQALDEAMKSIVRYGPNESLVIDDATWTKLHVQAGANDYVAEGPAWHLDGEIDAKYLANLTVNHIDMDTQAIMRTDTSVRTVGTSVNPGDMVRSFKNYTYDHSEPNHAITIQKNGENVINIYYQKNADRLFYDANGGEGTMSPSVGKAEEQVDVKANEFTKEGCKFSGWNTEPDGSGDDYAAGEKYTLTDGEDRLYAQWEQAGHIGYNLVIPGAEWDGGVPEGLEFYRNGNNGSDIYAETQLYAENETTTVISATPKAEGYAFVGWYDKYRGEGQGQGTYRDAGDTLTYPYSNGSDYTLDALWVKIAATGGKTTYDGTEHHIDAQSQYESGTLESEYIQDIVGQGIVQFGDMQYRYQKDGGDWSEWSTVNPDLINAGTYNVQVKQTATVGSKETELTAEATYTIDPVQLTVKANDASKVYDGTPLTEGGYQIVSGKFVGEEGFSSVTVEGTITDPGTEANKVTGWEFAEGTLADNYSVTPQDGTLTVSKVTSEIVITADSSHKTYDGTPLTDDGFTYTQGVLAEGDELTAVVEGSATNVSDGRVANEVTSYKVMRGETDVTDNYTFGESVAGELYIDPVQLTVKANDASKVYDGTPLTEGGYQIVSGKFVGEEGFSSVTVEGTITDPGTEANKVTGWEFAEGTLADNYSVTPQDGTLTVSKVTSEIVLTADSRHKPYDGTPLTDDGFTYTQGVLAEGDELTAVVEGSATNVSDGRVANEVTSYKVMRGETDVTDNYTFGESVAGELYI